ncbi:MAG: leucine--tRNA ligase [Candidatus Aenigmarchaeota archaeon]|nr:leucine--tRNA ligase [Candidatus Aenigmarchaeota archaeon]
MPLKLDSRAVEKKWQQRWEEKKTFQPRSGKGKKCFLTVPYPYTSGPLHIGHARTYTLADIWARFKRMVGWNVLFPMAFHISGTPILSVADRIRAMKGETIALYRGYVSLYEKNKNKVEKIVESFSDPKEVANYFSGVISKDFKSLGFSIDWSRTFTTGDPAYNKFIEWQFLTLKQKGLIKRGVHAVQFCPKDNNAVGEDDIKDGDLLDTRIETFTTVKFPFRDGFLLAATLRPETIFGVTNIWIHPEKTYVKARVGKEIWYVSKDALEKLKNQNHKVKKLAEFPGKKLLKEKARSTVDRRQIPLLPATFVDTSFATGVVYSVPAHSPDDFITLKDIGSSIKPIPVIKLPGFGDCPAGEIVKKMGIKSQKEREKLKEATKHLYKEEFYKGVLKSCGKFSGTTVREIKDSVKNWLEKDKKALDFFVSSTPHLTCRCGEKVIVKVLPDQWFIDYKNKRWKALAKKCLKKMEIIPEQYRSSFEATIDWLHERACARRRGLGTALPWDNNWVIESLADSTIYPAFYLLSPALKKISPKKLTKEFFDFVLLGKGTTSAISGVDKKLLEELRKEFTYWYPVDERHTAIPHISNHLTFYLFNHAALFPEKHWPKMITLNELLIREGSKMSKSKGNVIPLADIAEKYSADLYRLYIAYGAEMNAVIDWSEDAINMVRKRLGGFIEFSQKRGGGEETPIDAWLLSRFNTAAKDAAESIESFSFRQYVQQAFFNMMNDISHYIRRGGESPVLEKVIKDWIKILSPVIPHTCEELWESLGGKGFVSTQPWPRPNIKFINPRLEKQEELVMQTLDDINKIIKLINKKPKTIHLFVAPLWKHEVYRTLLKEAGDKKGMIQKLMKNPEIRKQGKDAVHFAEDLLNAIGKLTWILTKDEELNALKEAASFFQKETGAEVNVCSTPGKDPQNKAKLAKPMKPAIYVE